MALEILFSTLGISFFIYFLIKLVGLDCHFIKYLIFDFQAAFI